MHKFVIGAASAVALSAISFAAAQADPVAAAPGYAIVPQAVIGGNYSYIDLNHGGSANSFGGDAGGILPFGGGFSGQVQGGYHAIDSSGGGGSVSTYDIGGDVAWSSDMGRIGANVAYAGNASGGVNASVTNYGAFGEYYFNDQFTAGLRAGGATLQGTGALGSLHGSGSSTGGYVGGELVGYATPDIDVQGHVQYVGIKQGSQTTAGVEAEWLFSESLPISGWVGYDYATLSGGGATESTNTISVGLNFYIGGDGSLVQRHRSGVDDWGPSAVNIIF